MPNPFHSPYRISQNFGPTDVTAEPALRGENHYHCGIDIVGPASDAPIYSVCVGTVFQYGEDSSDGAKYVIIFAGPDKYIAYWHLSAITCPPVGSNVTTDTMIGRQGSTGKSTAPHLHLEVQQKQPYGKSLHTPNNPINPNYYLQELDMNPIEIVRGIRRITNPTNAVPDSVINADAARIVAEGRIDGVLADNLNSVPWRNPERFNVTSLEIYDQARGGTDPHGFATSRVLGGQDFQAVMNLDMPVYKSAESQVATLSQKLQDATIDAFKQAYLTRAGEYPTKNQVADWQSSQADIPTWVNTYAPSRNEIELQRQLDQQSQSISKLQTTTQQAIKDKDDTISRLQAQLDGKTPPAPVEPAPASDGRIVFSPTPEPEKKSGSFLNWLVDILKTLLNGGK